MDSIESNHDGLSILELKESTLVEDRLLRFLLVLGSRDTALVGRRAPAQPDDFRIVAVFRDAIADLRLVRFTANLRCETSRVRVRSRQKDLGPEGLHQRL